MRRPLAAFGFAFLLASLAACLLPGRAVLALGALLGAAFLVWMLAWLRKRRRVLAVARDAGAGRAPARKREVILPADAPSPALRVALPLVLCALAAAFLWRAGYDAAVAAPVRALAGGEGECVATARVEDVAPGYGGDTVHATLRVLGLDGQTVQPFRVQLRGVAEVEIGELVSVPLRFYALSGSMVSTSGAKGVYVGARAADAPAKVGEDLTLLCRLRLLRYAAGDNIHARLPLRLSSVAAAMSVGDRRYLQPDTIQAYRAAGLSHMLVVSGLHLTILTGIAYWVFGKLLRRRWLVSAAAMAVVLFFMAFTGFTPSIVRSGVGSLLVLAAGLAGRRADIYTSLGFAGLLLCLQNPYAAADVGLLLSFSATLGAVWGGGAAKQLKSRYKGRRSPPARAGLYLLEPVLLSVFTTLATLPVVIWMSGGVALLSVPMNVIAVPLLGPIVVCGLLMALPSWALLGVVTLPARFVGGALLAFLEKLTNGCAALCEAHPWLYPTVGGAFALLVVLLVYALVLLAFRTRWRKGYLAGAAAVVALSVALHLGLSAGTVRITVAGSGATSSVIVAKDGQAVVLYRGRTSVSAVQRALTQQGVRDCVLFVDMRRNPQGTEYESRFAPQQVLVQCEEVAGQKTLQPLDGVRVYLKNQGGGSVACVDVEGYKVALSTGSVDLSAYSDVDLLVAGGGEVQAGPGGYASLLVSGALPDWAADDAELIYSDGLPQLLIRPSVGVRMREVRDGPFEG